LQEFRKVTPRQGELAATHHRGGTASGLGSYTENISHVFKLSLTVEVELSFFSLLHGPKTGPAEPNFFFAQHVVQFKGTTKFDVIVADAKLVGSASDPAERLTQSP